MTGWKVSRRGAVQAAAALPLLGLPRAARAQFVPMGQIDLGQGPAAVFGVPGFPMGGQARPGPGGEPWIIINTFIGPPFREFVLAHEYAHHALNHITQYVAAQMVGGPMAACYLSPSNELMADSWATLKMRQMGNAAAVQAAFAVSAWSGFFAAPCYPPGVLRANNIQQTWFSP